LAANGLGNADIAIERGEEHERAGVVFELAAHPRVFRMNVACVRHEAGRQRYNSMRTLFAAHRAIRLDILPGIHRVAVAADVLADVSDAGVEVSIEVEERELKTRGEKSADGALARSARADESNSH
jgi:hypothetical protein